MEGSAMTEGTEDDLIPALDLIGLRAAIIEMHP